MRRICCRSFSSNWHVRRSLRAWLRRHRVRRNAEVAAPVEQFATQEDPDQAELAQRLTHALALLPLEQRCSSGETA
jgi:DNA-directed RNA polymerase specialized sigma24 family protein